jgi:CheY-like chemotaxis protein
MPAPAHFLIVAHNHNVTAALLRLLGSAYPSATLSIAANGVDALAMVARRPPDLLITDYRMPAMDGLTLVRRLRAQQASFPVLLLSSDSALESQALAAGAAGFLLKPFRMLVLYEALDALLLRAF